MAGGGGVQFDFSDIGGQRVRQGLDFSELGGQRVEQSGGQQGPGGFFDKVGSLGTLSVESHPEWVKGWRASAGPSPQPQKPTLPTSPNHQAKPLDFSDIGGRRVSVPTSHVSQQTDGHDFSSSTEARLGQAAQPQPQKSTWGQLADLNNAINDAEMRTVVGAGNDLWGTVQGIGSLFEPPDFMRHPIEQRPKTLGEAISQGAQAGAYATGLTTVGRAVKGYYDATQQNMDRLHQAADKGDTAGVSFNS